jgi:DNA-binding transcriptional ArsR family regulator
VATLTGRTARSTSPSCDTPGVNLKNPASPDGLSRTAAGDAWHAVTAAIAGTAHVRISKDGGRTYPARHARPLPADPPGQPSTVPVYDPGTGTGRMLALDLDVPRAGSPSAVEGQAAALSGLLGRLGGRCVCDSAPGGGCHVYVLFAAPLPWRELRDVARALALRFPAIDPAPMCSLGGQISPPGSRHKSGGWRLLSTPLDEARAGAGSPNGPEVWDSLLTELAAELRLVAPIEPAGEVPEGAELDGGGVPWVPRLGGRAPLGAQLEHVARTGEHRGRGRSEARMAVLAAAAARGWQLADVRAAAACGAWRGLGRLYERPSEPGRMDRLLPLEWRKMIAFVTGEKNLRRRPTSDTVSRPPLPEPALAAEYGLIRQWLTAVLVALEDPERVRRWGGRVIAVRLVLLALGQAAMVSGSSVVEFGCRNLALHSALSHRTVARVLELLRDEPDPLVDLISRRQAARADRYQLRIPAAYADSVRWRRRHAGRVEAAHPAFLVLGGTAALTYQVLDAADARGAEVARAARLSPSAVSAALRILAEHGLAEHGRRGWRRGPSVLDDVAEAAGAAELHRERAERYERDRESWRARLRQYASARRALVAPGDGWLGLDDEDEWMAMLASRWPVLGNDFVRGPPQAVQESA